MASRPPTPEFRLDPLAFPAETNMRFLLLLIAAAGTITGLADFAVYVLVQYLPIDDLTARRISRVCAFAIAALLFALAHWRARRAARALIASEGWMPFPPASRDPLERLSLARMRAHVGQLVDELPEVAPHQPGFLWNASAADRHQPGGMAFGYRRRLYVCLNEGLHAAFVGTPRPEFHGVLLHELGHIANRDVSRTTFSIELGRTFTQVAVALAVVTDGYLIFHIVRRFLRGTSDQTDIQGLGIILQIALGTALVIALVEVIRASILRVREYYADTRARQWLGGPASLIALFEHPTRAAVPSPAALGIVQRRVRLPSPLALGRAYLAPLHPSQTRRLDALRNPRTLFAVDTWTALVAGLLSGLALNANSLLLSVPLQFGAMANAWLSSSMNEQMSRPALLAIFALSVLLSLLAFALLAALLGAFFLAPLVGTVGVMVQRAAVADRAVRTGPALLPLWRLALLALLIGAGIVLGAALTPASGALTLKQADWPLAPIFVCVWSGVVFVWLVPLRWLGARAYRSYAGAAPPVFRRRCLAALAGLALAPLLFFTLFGQGAITTADANPLTQELADGLRYGWLLSFPLSGAIWGVGALLMWLAGWFSMPRCPGCGARARHSSTISLHCGSCGQPLRPWMLVPAPIRIPAPPRPPAPPGEAAPPL